MYTWSSFEVQYDFLFSEAFSDGVSMPVILNTWTLKIHLQRMFAKCQICCLRPLSHRWTDQFRLSDFQANPIGPFIALYGAADVNGHVSIYAACFHSGQICWKQMDRNLFTVSLKKIKNKGCCVRLSSRVPSVPALFTPSSSRGRHSTASVDEAGSMNRGGGPFQSSICPPFVDRISFIEAVVWLLWVEEGFGKGRTVCTLDESLTQLT